MKWFLAFCSVAGLAVAPSTMGPAFVPLKHRGGRGSHTCLTPLRRDDHHRTYEVVPSLLLSGGAGRGAVNDGTRVRAVETPGWAWVAHLLDTTTEGRPSSDV